MDSPVFDAVIGAWVDGDSRDVVVHRNAAGATFAFHSPLERGPVHCEICEAPGSRVHLTEGH